MNKLDELLAGIPHGKLGWDWYDRSLEIYDVPDDYRLNEEEQKSIFAAGFCKVYVNHFNKWETHYSFDLQQPFKLSKGWRVSYPHKRGAEEKQIWVEERIPGWPQEWFDTGYVIVKNAL